MPQREAMASVALKGSMKDVFAFLTREMNAGGERRTVIESLRAAAEKLREATHQLESSVSVAITTDEIAMIRKGKPHISASNTETRRLVSSHMRRAGLAAIERLMFQPQSDADLSWNACIRKSVSSPSQASMKKAALVELGERRVHVYRNHENHYLIHFDPPDRGEPPYYFLINKDIDRHIESGLKAHYPEHIPWVASESLEEGRTFLEMHGEVAEAPTAELLGAIAAKVDWDKMVGLLATPDGPKMER